MPDATRSEFVEWFESQAQRSDLPLPERLMLENVSRWLRAQRTGEPQRVTADPWMGLSV